MSMGNLYESSLTILEIGLTYSVCAIVWMTLLVGLCQLILFKVSQIHFMHKRPRQLLQSHQGSIH